MSTIPADPTGSWTPTLPPSRVVTLPRRGSLSVREAAGPEGGPTFVLLHGLTATADLNWFSVFEPLAQIGSIVALDQRGHGDGIRDRHLTLETCADDVAAVLDELGVPSCILVGFSMGGAVSQLVWRRHRPRVRGLVLVATAARFPSRPTQRALWAGMAAAGPILERVRPRLEDLAVGRAQRGAAPNPRQVWAQAQLRRNDPLDLLSARRSLASFSSMPWCRSIDVPASFVLTLRDQVVPPEHQRELIAAVGDCEVETIDAEHGAFVEAPELFAPAVERAARSVASRLR
jgi:3-oxoadipate enol-lactonase